MDKLLLALISADGFSVGAVAGAVVFAPLSFWVGTEVGRLRTWRSVRAALAVPQPEDCAYGDVPLVPR